MSYEYQPAGYWPTGYWPTGYWPGGGAVMQWIIAAMLASAGSTVQSGSIIGVIGGSVMADQIVDVVGAGVLTGAERLAAGPVVEG